MCFQEKDSPVDLSTFLEEFEPAEPVSEKEAAEPGGFGEGGEP